MFIQFYKSNTLICTVYFQQHYIYTFNFIVILKDMVKIKTFNIEYLFKRTFRKIL